MAANFGGAALGAEELAYKVNLLNDEAVRAGLGRLMQVVGQVAASAEQAARKELTALERADAAIAKATTNWNRLQKAKREAVVATRGADVAFKDMRQTAMQLGQGLTSVNPAVGQLVGAFSGMTAAVGPIGIALAGIVGVMNLIGAASEESAARVQELENRLQSLRGPLADFISQQQQSDALRAERRRLEEGEGTAAELEAEADRLLEVSSTLAALSHERSGRVREATEQEADRVLAQSRALRERAETAGGAVTIEEGELLVVPSGVDRQRYEDLIAVGFAPSQAVGMARLQRGGGGQAAARLRREYADLRQQLEFDTGGRGGAPGEAVNIEEIRAERDAESEREIARFRARGDEMRRAAEQRAEIEAEQREEAMQRTRTLVEAQHEFRDESVRDLDRIAEAWTEYSRAVDRSTGQSLRTMTLMERGIRATGATIIDVFGTQVRSAFEESVNAVISGEESVGEAFKRMAKEIVKSLVARSIVEAAAEGAAAIASAATMNFPAAALHGAAAAAWLAVGGAAAGVGLATGAFKGGGGGDKGGGASRGGGGLPRDRGTTRPTAGAGENVTLVMNINAPVDNPASMGKWIIGRVRAARRVYGSSARIDD